MKSFYVQNKDDMSLWSEEVNICYIDFIQELNEAWERLKSLSLRRQDKLFGAHEIQHFNR